MISAESILNKKGRGRSNLTFLSKNRCLAEATARLWVKQAQFTQSGSKYPGNELGTHSHGGDGTLGEEPLVFPELPIPLVRLRGRLVVDGEVAVPSADDVAVQVGVLQVGPLEGVDLTLQVGKSFLLVDKSRLE